MSLVILTVLAGVGQGVFMILVALDILLFSSGALPAELVYGAGAASLIFPAIGVAASFFHLGNPGIGYKAVKMFKQSWLSKEVVFLPLFLFFAFWYLALYHAGAPDIYRLVVGCIGVAAAFGAYLSSAMLYAAIRFIKEWGNPYTVINFIVFGVTSGAAVLFAVMSFTATGGLLSPFALFLIGAGVFSLLLKILTYRFNAKVYVPINIKNALGINSPDIRMVDMGTSYAHFNTEEYFFPIGERQNAAMEKYVLLAAFIVPTAIWVLIAMRTDAGINPALSVVAAASVVAGLLLERRLFFIQGNHIQNLYYGNFKSKNVKNPIVSKNRKNHPPPAKLPVSKPE